MSRVLVAGATGYLGRFVVRELKERGEWVRVLVRHPEKMRVPGPSLEPAIAELVDDVFVGEATRPETLGGLCDGIDVVFSSLGITRQADGFTPMQVDYRANRNLLDRAIEASVPKFVFVHVFNADRLGFLEAIRAKRRFVEDLRASGVGSTLICPTGFFSDMLEFLRMAKRGTVYQIGDGHARINPIHGADLAVVCADGMAGDRKEVPAGGPAACSYREIADLAFAALGRPPRILRVPPWAASLAVSLLRPVSRRYYNMAAGIATIAQMDCVAPSYGTRGLGEYYREIAPML